MLRRSSVSSRVPASTPSMRIRPLVGSMSRLTILSEVVLPQPEGPTKTQILPAGNARRRAVAGRGGGRGVRWQGRAVGGAGGRGRGPVLALGRRVVAFGHVVELDDCGAVLGLDGH